MKVINTITECRKLCQRMARPLGLVPTMGFLHEGHMALVHQARRENSNVVVSLFVNPTQFSEHEDFLSYPQDMDSDLSILKGMEVDVAFAPSVEEMYPCGSGTYLDVGRVASRLEGVFRPGHFRGVATVVCKLLSIVRPDRAYFGQKDAQQNLVVSSLNADLNLGAKIVVVPTVREKDGLSVSSRNIHLSVEGRAAAPVLYRAICLAKSLWKSGISDAEAVRRQMRELIEEEPLANVDYVSIAHPESLEELDVIKPPALVSLAVRIGKTRLIDNIVL